MELWVHNIDPIALQLGPLKIHWYGLMYMIGFAAAWQLGLYRGRKQGGWSEQQIADLIFWGAMGVILGGRLGYVIFYHFDRFLEDPLWLFAVWEGGMSFHGGLIGVVVAITLFGRQHKKSMFQMGDFIAPLVPIGLAAGRLGNYIGGELWGRATDQSWGVIFPRAGDGLARHPSQLYEMLLEGVVMFVMLWLYSAKTRPEKAVSGLFLLLYGLFRTVVEFFREPDAHLGFIFQGMTMGQLLSFPMIVAGVAIMIWAYRAPVVRGSEAVK